MCDHFRTLHFVAGGHGSTRCPSWGDIWPSEVIWGQSLWIYFPFQVILSIEVTYIWSSTVPVHDYFGYSVTMYINISNIWLQELQIWKEILKKLFFCRWIEERRSRRKVVENTDNYVQDEAVVNNMFFAQQVYIRSLAKLRCEHVIPSGNCYLSCIHVLDNVMCVFTW